MTRILHLISSLNTGGAEMMLYKLLSGMNKEVFKSRVVSLIPPGPIGNKIESINIQVDHLGLDRGFFSPMAIFKLTGMINEFKPDLIQTWMYHSDLLGFLTSKITRTGKVIWNIRCSSMELTHYHFFTRWAVILCKLLSRFSQVTITNSYTARADHLKMGYRPKRFQVIPNGFDLSQFKSSEAAKIELRRELKLEEKALCIGLIARYDPKKDHSTFLKAINRITHTHRNCNFILCGDSVDSKNAELINIMRELEIGPFVHLLGRRGDISRIIGAMDIIVLSSAFGEGFPNVIGEAMSCEVPCVVTDVGDSARIVGGNGKVVPPRNPGALAKAIIELIDLTPEARQTMGKKARERINSEYSLENIVKQYETLYRSMTVNG